MRDQMGISLAALVLICTHLHIAQSRSIPRIIDLSYPYDNETYYYPTNAEKKFHFEVVFKGRAESGTWVQAYKFCSYEHGGTHIDAPSHFSEGDWTVDEIPIERLVRKGVRFNISERAATDRNTLLTVADIEAWERDNGQVPEGAIALLHTGWGQYWGNDTAFAGSVDPPFHFPSYSEEAANWLYENRNISGLGVDTPSIDAGNSRHNPNHVTLLAKRVIFLENVAYLDKLPAKDFTLYVMPIKLRGGSGGPTRIFAIVDDAAEQTEQTVTDDQPIATNE